MQRKSVQVGGRYLAKVSGELTIVRLTSKRDPIEGYAWHRGWTAINEKTGREVHIRSAARLRPIEWYVIKDGRLVKRADEQPDRSGDAHREHNSFDEPRCE